MSSAAADNAHGLMLDARIGGSPLNVAIGLARLAQPVAFFGAVSTGFLGERLMRALRDEGVATDAVARLDAPTTLGLVGLDARGVPVVLVLRRRLRRPAAAAGRAGRACRPRRGPSTSAPTRWWSSRWPRRSARWSSASTGAA